MATIQRTIQRTESYTTTETRTRTTEDAQGNGQTETFTVDVPQTRLVTETITEQVPDKLDLLPEDDLAAIEEAWPEGPLEPSQEADEDVEAMQDRLIELGYLDAGVVEGAEGVYGPSTTEAVRRFQLANGVYPVDGEASVETLAAMGAPTALSLEEALDELEDTVIGGTLGVAGPEPVPTVETLDAEAEDGDPRVSARLEALGYIPPDAPVDAEAITNFQLMNGLEGTGTLDDETLAAMWSEDAVVSNHIRQVVNDTYNHSDDAPARSNNCGPTSVAMATASLGLTTIDNDDPQQAIDDARAETGGTNSSRTGPGDLEDAVEAAGGQTYRLDSLDEAKLAIGNGDPVILFGTDYDGHWVVAQGYDPETDTWLVSDPMSTTGVARWSDERMQAYFDPSVDSVAVHETADPVD